MLIRIKKQRGSASIEATISLTVFLFFIVTIYSIVNFCRAQALVANAINQSAKEMSQYSYFYKLSGLQKYEKALDASATGTKTNLDEVIKSTDGIYNAIGEGSNKATAGVDGMLENKDSLEKYLTDSKASYDDINGKMNEFSDKFKNLFSDPKGLMIGMAAIAGQGTLETAKSRLIAAPVAKMLSKKYFELPGKSADDRLKSLGVVDGFDGLNYNLSTIFAEGSSEIEVTVIYRVKVMQLLPIKSEAVFCQHAYTRGWISGDKETDPKLIVNNTTGQKDYVDPGDEADAAVKQNDVWDKAATTRGKEIVAAEKLKLTGDKITKNVDNCHGYSPGNNEFIYITSINTYSDSYKGAGLATQLTTRTNNFKNSVSPITSVTLSNGTTVKLPVDKAKNFTLKLVVPDNAELSKIQGLLDANGMYNGVKVEIVTGYGNADTK